MLDHVFTDAISALRESLEGVSLLERQTAEERFTTDLTLGDVTWSSSYSLPGEARPARIRADITLIWPTWSQSSYRSWVLDEPRTEEPRIELEATLRIQELSEVPGLDAVLAALPARSPDIGADPLDRSGPTVETLWSENLEESFHAIEITYDGSYELQERVLDDGNLLDQHFGVMGAWVASTLVKIGDLPLTYRNRIGH